ncbi:MAG: RNA-binding protein [Magnetococcales bacterium]|nr:RNA-binding protein [Magnetococcales bacterium]
MKKQLVLLVFACALMTASLAQAITGGDYARVRWKGKWYDAEVRQVSGTQLLIHYTGYENSWDEWVSMDRVAIQVYWKDTWYKASALESGDNKVLIHYDGYEDNWDEWVNLNRIRSYK